MSLNPGQFCATSGNVPLNEQLSNGKTAVIITFIVSDVKGHSYWWPRGDHVASRPIYLWISQLALTQAKILPQVHSLMHFHKSTQVFSSQIKNWNSPASWKPSSGPLLCHSHPQYCVFQELHIDLSLPQLSVGMIEFLVDETVSSSTSIWFWLHTENKGTWAEVQVPFQVAKFWKKTGCRRSMKIFYSLSTGRAGLGPNLGSPDA